MIAKTILEQIGGRRFAAMTGSKDFTDMGNGLRMSLARNKTSANRLDIIYDGGADPLKLQKTKTAALSSFRFIIKRSLPPFASALQSLKNKRRKI